MDLRFFTLCIVLLLSQPSFALKSEVMSVHPKKPAVYVSQDSKEPFEKDDMVCVTQRKRDIACGEVIVAKEKYAVMHIAEQRQDVKKNIVKTKKEIKVELSFDYPIPTKGDGVRLVYKDPKNQIRQLASVLASTNKFGGEIISEPRQRELDSTIEKLESFKPFKPISVFSAGMNFVSPTVQYAQSFSNSSALGVMPVYLNYPVSDGSLKGPGAFLTYNHYSESPFNGFWWQVSAGAYGITATYNGASGNLIAPAALSSVGWRMTWKDMMNFGFGLGGQYLMTGSNPGSTGLSFNGFIPSILFDAGFIF